ncbi:MAG: hypothetical protein ACE5GI_04815, partial [Candidatus Aminicenantales bacterium]
PIEVKSLLTDFKQIEEIAYSEALDGFIILEESNQKPSYTYNSRQPKFKFKGQLANLSRQASDLRFSFWGNQGLLYRFVLYLLEKKHQIYNFHACALYDPDQDKLFVIMGGAGSGKSAYLLSGLIKGLKLFSTETVHFQIKSSNLIWYLGSLVDNVRWGTLLYDFPQFLPEGKQPPSREKWQKKVALDLSSYRYSRDRLISPASVTIIFPHIEEDRHDFNYLPIKDKKKAAKAVFDNISQKITETVLLYDILPLLGLDEKELARRRLEAAYSFINHQTVVQTVAVVSNPENCWRNILK